MPGRVSLKGLRQFLEDEQQQAWLDGEATRDGERPDPTEHNGIEQRFKFAGRFDKLLGKPQAEDVLDILRIYAATCLPIPRLTERYYWSVSCLPSTDKALARVNASWMELFALMPDGDKLWSRIILHIADFTTDGSDEAEALDHDLLAECVGRAEDVSHHFWGKHGILVVKVRGAASIRHFLAHPHGLRAIRGFNLKYMNRGRNAYQASHCYSLADAMLGE
jgi:hypothetical protein